jgi:hypothetical protein
LLGQARFPAQVCKLTGYLLGGILKGKRGHFGTHGLSACRVRNFHATEHKKS